ncbi:MAG: hypothetical protein ACK4NQ_11685 [Fimbriimonadaceae bacterium]
MFKKFAPVAVLALIALPAALCLAGCDEETRPDPELQKQRDEQRAGMMPGGGQPAPGGGQPAPGGQPMPGGGTR